MNLYIIFQHNLSWLCQPAFTFAHRKDKRTTRWLLFVSPFFSQHRRHCLTSHISREEGRMTSRLLPPISIQYSHPLIKLSQFSQTSETHPLQMTNKSSTCNYIRDYMHVQHSTITNLFIDNKSFYIIISSN